MREFIYLSDRKLQQFLPEAIPAWRRIGRLKAQINAPIGSISVESSTANDSQAARVAQLQNVVRHVEQSAKWWDADDVEAGDWIFLEERINYWVIQVAKGSAVVLFLKLAQDEIRRTRLLLHGSPEHLTSAVKAQHRLRSESASLSPSDGFRFRDMLPVLRKVVHSLDNGSKKEGPYGARNLSWDIEDLVLELDKSSTPATAMWLAGYARVTARIEASSTKKTKATLMTASPLYLEVLMPPDDVSRPADEAV
jgi:hypothetical protein